ncbi:MAG TPA: hypothetical protein VJU86_07480 [Pyrinomonadaceae bacterium]|nr:hypothetical protein [Pyrinomonadaceae bacterium]
MPRRSSRYNKTLKGKSAIANEPVQDLGEILPPSAEEFKTLYKLARYIQQNEPWEYMEETDVFGVKDPDTGELGFVSVMGALGEYTAVAVYRGIEGLYGWRKFEEWLEIDPESEEAHDMLMEIPQLQLSFGPASFLESHDRVAIKRSGVRFPNDLPLFRSYWPGYYPWYLTRGEALHLIHVLTQTIQVAKQFFYDESVIPLNEDPEDRDYLIRVPKLTNGVVRWQSSIERIDEPNIPLIPIDVDDDAVDQLKALPKPDPQEIDLFTLPAKLGEANERSRVLYALLVTNSLTGYLYGFEALDARDGVDLMYADLAEKVAKIWLRQGVVPSELRARSSRLLNMFQYLAGEVGFELSLVKELPSVDEAKGFILEKMNM